MFHLLFVFVCALLMLPLGASVPAGTDLSQLNMGKSQKTYRHRTFAAYKPLQELHRTLKVGNYSSYENPTGIFYKCGERISLKLHDKPDGEIKLIICDFREGGKQETYPLTEGRNDITVKADGLGYIDYRSPKGCEARTVDISLDGGTINGIFTRHDNTDTWCRLIAKLPAGILDMMGERCQVIFHAEGIRQGAPEQGVEMLALYDRIVELQQKLMGWDSEGIHPGNHITCRVVWRGYMHADGLGAAFHKDTVAGLCNPEGLRQAAWGVSHELGHINQVRPGFCWVGAAEVTNNIFSSWSNYNLYPRAMRLEHEVTSSADGKNMRGGRFDCYINNAIVKNQLWQFQSGPDSGVDKVPGQYTGDHFVSVCPLWQLVLYFHVARNRSDFYPYIFQQVRAFDDKNAPHGQLRLNFCRYASEAAKLDLSYFLLRTGILAPINRYVHDYGSHMMTITEEMVEKTVEKAARFPQPDSTVIYYINANNVNMYRLRLPVKPSRDFRPRIPSGGGDVLIPKGKWRNSVAFEVYKGKQLVRVCLLGLGNEDNVSTTVVCPPGATAIRAVQWDGKRFTVVGADDDEEEEEEEDE